MKTPLEELAEDNDGWEVEKRETGYRLTDPKGVVFGRSRCLTEAEAEWLIGECSDTDEDREERRRLYWKSNGAAFRRGTAKTQSGGAPRVSASGWSGGKNVHPTYTFRYYSLHRDGFYTENMNRKKLGYYLDHPRNKMAGQNT